MENVPNAAAQTADFEFAALQEAKNYRDALVSDFSEYLHGNVLEVGAGIGQITDELLKIKPITRLVSLEPDPRFFSALMRQRFRHQIIKGTVRDLKNPQLWNAILNINVLEHIEDDERELGDYHRLLKGARGHLCLFVPARPEIYAPIDKDFGHFRRYTRKELKTKLERAGFMIHRLRYFNLIGYFAWWLNFCVLKKHDFSVGSVRFFDRRIFPIGHALEFGICPPPIGQSLMAVAQAV